MSLKLLPEAQEAYDDLLNSISDCRSISERELSLKETARLTRTYQFNAVGDCCPGDRIAFVKRLSARGAVSRHGAFGNLVSGYQIVEGEIVREFSVNDTRQHTFTVLMECGERVLIKARNLYAVGVWRKAWSDESQRAEIMLERHNRTIANQQAATDRPDSYDIAI